MYQCTTVPRFLQDKHPLQWLNSQHKAKQLSTIHWYSLSTLTLFSMHPVINVPLPSLCRITNSPLLNVTLYTSARPVHTHTHLYSYCPIQNSPDHGPYMHRGTQPSIAINTLIHMHSSINILAKYTVHNKLSLMRYIHTQ